MQATRDGPSGLVVALLLAASFALLGWSHRPIVPAAPSLSTYLLPGGIAPDLCLSSGAERRAPGLATLCDACLLAKAALTPPPAAALLAPRAVAVGVGARAPSAPATATVWRPAQARAPPPGC